MYPAAKQGLTYTVPASVVYVADVAFLRNAELTSIAFADDSACVFGRGQAALRVLRR